MAETWRLMVGLVLVIIAFDFILGLPFVYGKQGLQGQTLSGSTRLSSDVIVGSWLEKTLYTCSSWQDATARNGLTECNNNQTLTVYYLESAVIPAIALIAMFTILNPKTFVGLLEEGL